jgi:hypothetical protein
MICPTCGKDNSRKTGFSIFKDSQNQRYQCKSCNRVWTTIGKNPKLLYLDIETSTIQVELFQPGKQYVSADRIKGDWFILCWSAKWVCSSSMFSYVVNPRDVAKRDDRRILKPLYDLLNMADIVIGHNADRFDLKRINWRFLMHGMKPPRPYRTVDTLKVARSIFGASGNSMDFLAKQLGLGEKLEMHFTDWDKCMEGNIEALRKMRKYNEHDILVGESLYLKMRPWMKNHPNLGLYYETDTQRCKNCGSTDLDVDENFPVYTGVNAYECWTCIPCGAHGRTAVSVLDKEKRKELVR